MKCPSCNAELADDAKFCNVCGTAVNAAPASAVPENNEPKVEAVAPASENNESKAEDAAPAMNQVPVNPQPGMVPPVQPQMVNAPVTKKKFPLIPVICGGVGLLIIIIVAIILIATHKTKVNLNDYITVNFDGYDTIGTAEVEFDYSAFLEDYGNKIKFTSDGRRASGANAGREAVAAQDLIQRQVEYELDEYSGLTNGDIVTVTWDINDEVVSKYFKVNLVYEPIEFVVEGLDKAEIVDPFDDCEITFSGLSGEGTVVVNYTGNLDIYFDADEEYYLSNGDTITVTAYTGWYDEINDETFINKGIIVEQTQKEFTVEGLTAYVTSASEITDESIDEMMSQVNDIFLSQSSYWASNVTYNGCVYTGYYFTRSKNSNSNYIYVVCNIAAVIDDDGTEIPVNYFDVVRFSNLTVDTDGNVFVALSRYDTGYSGTLRYFDVDELEWTDDWWYGDYNFDGYQSIDDIYQNNIVQYAADYVIESTF